tara:strand:- start:442 stop:684 length:243 start_codon:yes stop_codon:yes gene_type:complete
VLDKIDQLVSYKIKIILFYIKKKIMNFISEECDAGHLFINHLLIERINMIKPRQFIAISTNVCSISVNESKYVKIKSIFF